MKNAQLLLYSCYTLGPINDHSNNAVDCMQVEIKPCPNVDVKF